MNGDQLADIRFCAPEQIGRFFRDHKEEPYRARQVYEWLWKKRCHAFKEMTSLSKSIRQLLTDHFTFHTANLETTRHSADGTVKAGFRLHDGLMVEGVLIPSGGRYTACISSQAGCALGCKFCATGQLGFMRNLTPGEIFDQVTYLASLIPADSSGTGNPAEKALSNIVYMGMGEPFMNYENVTESIERLTSEDGSGISPQRITVSSIGIPKMIRRMAEDGPKYHFALSLHAATDQKRNQIIPFNLHHPLGEIIDALKYHYSRTGRRFTIEYILFRNFNDSLTDAKDLAGFCRNFPVKINIIEYNPVSGSGFDRSDEGKTKAFIRFLETRNLIVNLRKSRGKDIDAACGQLAMKTAS